MIVITSLEDPDALVVFVAATPETSAYFPVEVDVPEWSEERYATQHERAELEKKTQLQNAVIPWKRLVLLVLVRHSVPGVSGESFDHTKRSMIGFTLLHFHIIYLHHPTRTPVLESINSINDLA